MEQNIKRSEKVIKVKDVDQWIDGKGYFHRRVTKETITGPLNNVEASQRIGEPLVQRIIRPMMIRIQGNKIPLRQVQPQVNIGGSMFSPQPQQALQQESKPQMDFGALMAMGKKLMDDMGVDPKKFLNEILSETKEDDPKDLTDSKTDEKEVNKTWQKTMKKKPLKKQKQVKTKRIQKTQNNKSK